MQENRILIVDDDPMILSGYRRLLANYFNLFTLKSPRTALNLIKRGEHFAVIVSDYKMPEIDGNTFLDIIKDLSPNTIRIMLTGNADVDMAIESINEGEIFRFLRKPCPNKQFVKTLNDALKQYHLQQSEKVLLERTLQGSVKTLIEVLSMVNPEAFSFSRQTQQLSAKISKRLSFKNLWEIDLAAMLSSLGFVTMPQDIIEKVFHRKTLNIKEKEVFKTHPEIAAKLLTNIPRLEGVARGIALQLDNYLKTAKMSDKRAVQIGNLLKITTEYLLLEKKHISIPVAIHELRKRKLNYDPDMFQALITEVKQMEQTRAVKYVNITQIKSEMILAKDIKDESGTLLIPRGTMLTEILKIKLLNFIKLGRNLKSIEVIIDEEAVEEAVEPSGGN